ncbi:MAG TPA: ATP-dependent helicase HrpB [Planctomycetaceae bacterium]|nr:ATP-dependent helicase HrpB [Planctomycetaceae bacterium]
MLERLPIDDLLPALESALRTAPTVIVQAPPGAGKTTRIPPALLNRGLVQNGQILVLQPRRVAVRTTARRIAEERGTELGHEIGYQIRFERRVSRQTRIIVMTEGVLLRRLLDDPFLEGVDAVILDEFHERHLDTDLALAMVRRVQQTVRPDLKLLVMSATLQTEALQKYLGGCPILTSNVRPFPVQIEHHPVHDDRPIAELVAAAVENIFPKTAGDILAFVPGYGEIQRTIALLEADAAGRDLVVLPLYGDLAPELQDRVFATTAQRKIIVATNVAETSITIPGVTTVIDSGWARTMQFDQAHGLNRLELRPISRASAEQRAGRAGRTGPGLCIRLWTEASHRARPAADVAEIHRTDLSGAVLSLRVWGEHDLDAFPWFERPSNSSLSHAEQLLSSLDAVEDAGVTKLGSEMSRWPTAPRLARLILRAAELGYLEDGCLAAALLSERDPFVSTRRTTARHVSQSDLLDRIAALREFQRSGRLESDLGTLHRGGAQAVLQAAQQFERMADRKTSKAEVAQTEALGRALLAAFPDRLARRREPRSRRGVMVGHRGVRLADGSAVTDSDFFVCLDIDSAGDEALVRSASAVDFSWLAPPHLSTQIDLEFDETAERVQARHRTRWFDLVLEEHPTAIPADVDTASVLSDAARVRWSRVFPPNDEAVSQLVARLQCLHEWMPDAGFPAWTDDQLQALLPDLAAGCRSFRELRAAPWTAVLKQSLSPPQQLLLEREAPERLTVPSGSRIALDYAPGRAPILAVRIQEIFGWKATPRVAGGRVPVLLHLLAPNHRPQQITDDLTSFWTTAYQQVRGELRRRYPKHAWPEDPWTAVAERKPQRKPSG